jgi:hypothetical protein
MAEDVPFPFPKQDVKKIECCAEAVKDGLSIRI